MSRGPRVARAPQGRLANRPDQNALPLHGDRRAAPERRAIAEFVTGTKLADALSTTPSAQALCATSADDFANPLSGALWAGWGVNTSNTRFQDGAMAGFTAADVPRLKLKWAFGYHTAGGAPGNVLLAFSVDGK